MRGLQRGLAHAGRAKGIEGDEEEVAVESVARIASDLILMGQGRDVLAIYAQAAPKSDEGDDPEGKKSPLVRALERLPGMSGVPEQSTAADRRAQKGLKTQNQAEGTTNPQSVVPHHHPFFAPQGRLLPPDLEAPARSSSEPPRGPDTRASARPGGGDPLPPGSASPPYTSGNTENFEKKSPAEAAAE